MDFHASPAAHLRTKMPFVALAAAGLMLLTLFPGAMTRSPFWAARGSDIG